MSPALSSAVCPESLAAPVTPASRDRVGRRMSSQHNASNGSPFGNVGHGVTHLTNAKGTVRIGTWLQPGTPGLSRSACVPCRIACCHDSPCLEGFICIVDFPHEAESGGEGQACQCSPCLCIGSNAHAEFGSGNLLTDSCLTCDAYS